MADNIVIRRPRMVVVLTETEVLDMLKNNPDVWAVALKRGKGYCRYETAMERRPKR